MRAVMDKYKYKRRQIRELQEDLGSMQGTLDNLTTDEQGLVEVITEKQSKADKFTERTGRTENKAGQSCSRASKIARTVRSAKKSSGELHEERTWIWESCESSTRGPWNRWARSCTGHPDLGPSVQIYFSQAGLPMPPSPGPRYVAANIVT